MTDPRNDDRSQARREAAALLGVDIDHLSPADGLRVDMVSALRLVIDAEQANVLSGGSADIAKLNIAVSSLIALLPGRELPAPSEQHGDPRQQMWEIYRTMRERGELNLKPLGQVEALQAKVAELEAQLAGAPLKVGNVADFESVPRGGSTAITPPLSAITPPGELGQCHVGDLRGPDDPPPRSTTVIEGKAVTPAAPAAPKYDYDKEQGWKDYVLPDGNISPTPFGGSRKFWGPV
jgi:hypothetical protein